MIQKKENYMHSIRVMYENWIDPKRFEDLLTLFKKYPCNIQSLALFTSSTHAPITLEEMKRRADIMKVRLERARECGFAGGINILATIGHHEEDLLRGLGDKYTYMTGKTGAVCRGSYCMNDESFIENHVKPTYYILLSANPEFIWIDDDIRFDHMPIGSGCFCDNCVNIFNRKNNKNYTREELVKKLDSGCLETRRAWILQNSNTIKNLFKTIAEVVYTAAPDTTLGFMTGDRFMEGYDFKGFSEALSDGGKHKIMWRPGGGAYTDYTNDHIILKSEKMGRETAYLPEYVDIIQSEIENFPYQLIKKTPRSTAMEAAWTMASGCTGAVFNMLPCETNEPMANITAHLEEINNLKDFYVLLQNKVAGKKPIGVSAAWSVDCQIAVPEGRFESNAGIMYANCAREMFEFGLPQSYNPDTAYVNIVSGLATMHWDDQKMKKLLSRAVYMDAGALGNLNKRGYGQFTGFEIEKTVPVDAREYYVAHPINEGIIGGMRNCRQAFHPGDSYSLTPNNEKAKPLSILSDYAAKTLSFCAHGVYENTLGGRVSVGGYYPFSWVSDYYKTIQLKKLMVWLSKETLPSYVDTYCRIRNHTFKTENGYIVALLNHSNQIYKNVSVAINTDKDVARYYDMECNEHKVKCDKKKGVYGFFTIDKLAPYEMVMIEV